MVYPGCVGVYKAENSGIPRGVPRVVYLSTVPPPTMVGTMPPYYTLPILLLGIPRCTLYRLYSRSDVSTVSGAGDEALGSNLGIV